MSSRKPPVQMRSTTRSKPSTMSAPVRPRRIRSRLSAAPFPGATAARAARSSSSSFRSITSLFAMGAPSSVHPVASQSRRCRRRPRVVDRPPARRPMASMARRDVGDLDGADAGGHDGLDEAARRHERVAEAEPGRLGESAVEPGDPPHLAREPDLAEGDDVGGQRPVDDRRRDGADDGEVGGRLGDAHAADGGGEDVARADRRPARLSRTAMIIASRDAVEPADGAPRRRQRGRAPTSACTSATSGRRPSRVTVTHVPGTAWSRVDRNSPLGSARPVMPSSDRSKQPTSSVGPKRFFTARTSRSRECRSPSNWMTTSTRCSSTRGPAIEPSLVTWPTSSVAMPRALATPMRLPATSRTWVTLPAAPRRRRSRWSAPSRRRAAPATASTWPSTVARSVSAAR